MRWMSFPQQAMLVTLDSRAEKDLPVFRDAQVSEKHKRLPKLSESTKTYVFVTKNEFDVARVLV